MRTKIIIGIVALLVIAGAVFIVLYRGSLLPESSNPATAPIPGQTAATSTPN